MTIAVSVLRSSCHAPPVQTSIEGIAPGRRAKVLTHEQQAAASQLVIDMLCGRMSEAQCRAALEAL